MTALSRKDRALLTIAAAPGGSFRRAGRRYYAIVPVEAAGVVRLLRRGLLTYADDEPDHLVVSIAGRDELAE